MPTATRSRARPALILAITTLSIVGYFFGADLLYTVPHLTAIALPTSVMLLGLAVGVLVLSPGVEPMRTIQGNTAASVLVRRALGLMRLWQVHHMISISGEFLALMADEVEGSVYGTESKQFLALIATVGGRFVCGIDLRRCAWGSLAVWNRLNAFVRCAIRLLSGFRLFVNTDLVLGTGLPCHSTLFDRPPIRRLLVAC